MVLLGFDGKFFSIEALDRVITAKAEGKWPGLASVSANLIVALAIAPPAGDSIIVTCHKEHLRIASMTMGCTWQSVAHTLLKLPAASDWIEALSLKYRSTRAQILNGGYQRDIQNAERKLDKLIIKVAESLASLGVSEQDIRLLIETRLPSVTSAKAKHGIRISRRAYSIANTNRDARFLGFARANDVECCPQRRFDHMCRFRFSTRQLPRE